MIDLSLELILTTLVLSFWFVFPLGMFYVVFAMDKKGGSKTRTLIAR